MGFSLFLLVLFGLPLLYILWQELSYFLFTETTAMSWIRERELSIIERLTANILRVCIRELEKSREKLYKNENIFFYIYI